MNIKVLDNGGETMDRYTVVYLELLDKGVYQYQGMSENPQGFCQWGECSKDWVDSTTDKVVPLSALPFACQREVNRTIHSL